MQYLPKQKKEKFNFTQKKDNALKSLSEVEYFLRNIGQISKFLSLKKYFK